ncbi:class I SAM-dependent methyltransferase [Arthrobacter sp. YA7-1]|uniref:class I SAM-dependent methyltransferase n=1 Tax=Arthrobacter sp. YA7-1 TaxID=2987701 RepID=UPI0039B3E332
MLTKHPDTSRNEIGQNMSLPVNRGESGSDRHDAFRLVRKDAGDPRSRHAEPLENAKPRPHRVPCLGRATQICERRCVPADSSGPWMPALLEAGFDRRTPTVWVAEGLFFHLADSAVESLLRDTASLSAGGSIFLADVFGTVLLALESMAPLVKARTESGRALPFCTDTPDALFRAGRWTNTKLVQPGHPTANFGRLSWAPGVSGAEEQTNLRTYLVTAGL